MDKGTSTRHRASKVLVSTGNGIGQSECCNFSEHTRWKRAGKVKASQKQEALKAQEEEDNRLRLKYDTEDEFLANEK